MRRGLPLVLIAALACSAAVERFNAAGLQSDVADLVGSARASGAAIRCRMAGTSRTGACRVTLDPSARVGLLSRLGLAEGRGEPGWDRELEDGCPMGEGLHSGGSVPVYSAGGRPASLRLPGGAAFEWLVLYVDDSGEACLHVSYAYG